MTRRWKARRVGGLGLALPLVVAMVTPSCAPKAPETVSMRVRGGPPNATVTIDDRFVGTLAVVAARGVALPVGHHHVTVEAAGFFPWDKAVEAAPGQGPLRLDVTLLPIPD